jgi:hypothetical protein
LLGKKPLRYLRDPLPKVSGLRGGGRVARPVAESHCRPMVPLELRHAAKDVSRILQARHSTLSLRMADNASLT